MGCCSRLPCDPSCSAQRCTHACSMHETLSTAEKKTLPDICSKVATASRPGSYSEAAQNRLASPEKHLREFDHDWKCVRPNPGGLQIGSGFGQLTTRLWCGVGGVGAAMKHHAVVLYGAAYTTPGRASPCCTGTQGACAKSLRMACRHAHAAYRCRSGNRYRSAVAPGASVREIEQTCPWHRDSSPAHGAPRRCLSDSPQTVADEKEEVGSAKWPCVVGVQNRGGSKSDMASAWGRNRPSLGVLDRTWAGLGRMRGGLSRVGVGRFAAGVGHMIEGWADFVVGSTQAQVGCCGSGEVRSEPPRHIGNSPPPPMCSDAPKVFEFRTACAPEKHSTNLACCNEAEMSKRRGRSCGGVGARPQRGSYPR